MSTFDDEFLAWIDHVAGNCQDRCQYCDEEEKDEYFNDYDESERRSIEEMLNTQEWWNDPED